MKIKLKNNINYFPYKIFQRNNTNEKISIFNHSQIPQYRNIVIDISKNLKSVAISNKLFSSYMENYYNLTQDHCFKCPDNDSYPIRKNFRYLSASSVEKSNNFRKLNKTKILKKPLSSNNNHNIKLYNDKFYNKFIKHRNKKNDLLLALSEGEFYKKNNSKNSETNIQIDIDNNQKIKKEHFEYLKNYINNIKEYNEIFEETILSKTNALPTGNVKYELSIYSICLKFRALNDDKKINQKIYLKFKYLPIFYLLNYQLFKLFISEIIYYDNKSNSFSLINDNLDNIVEKYCKYINNYLNSKEVNINDITFFQNEFSFPLLFKWFIYNKDINDSKDNIERKPLIFELKIELPKIKFKIIENEIQIKSNLKKNLMIQLMKNKFFIWEQIILSHLYFIKKFRYIINSILLNNNKYFKQKLNLSTINNSKKDTGLIKINKNYEFFISGVNDNCSNYYIFNPYIIILRTKNKYYQEINLSFKESKILYKFSKIWGYRNTLLKCMNLNSEKYNKFSFEFNLLDNLSSNYIKLTNNRTNNKKEQLKFQFNKIDINIIECCLKKIIIKDTQILEKFIKISYKFLKFIFSNKENKFILYPNKVNDYLKEIKEEKKAEMKKGKLLKSIYDKELENSDIVLIEKNNSKINKKNDNNYSNNIKEDDSKYKNDKKIKINTDKGSNKINSFSEEKSKKKNSNVFLTKDFIQSNKQYLNIENEKNSNLPFSQYINLKKADNNKALYLIKNKRQLEKNRTIRESFIINSGNYNNFNQIKLAISNIRNKRYNSQIKKK